MSSEWTSAFADALAREQQLCKVWFQPDLTKEDRAWIRKHIELAGAQVPRLDVSWISTEAIR